MYLKQCTLTPYIYFYGGYPIQEYWQYSCGRVPTYVNYFNEEKIVNFRQAGGSPYTWSLLSASVGDWVIHVSQGNLSYGTWVPEVMGILGVAGVNLDSARKLKTGDPFMLIGKRTYFVEHNKGETILPNRTDTIPDNKEILTYSKLLTTCEDAGEMVSEFIGPSLKWEKLYQRFKRDTSDIIKLKVIGYKNIYDIGTILIDSVRGWETDLSFISNTEYPLLRLAAYLKDTNLSAAELKNWSVLYKDVPEGIASTDINTQQTFTIFEGQSLPFNANFRNITPNAFGDSIGVQVSVLQGQNTIQTYRYKYKALAGSEVINFELPNVSSVGLPSSCVIRVQFNTGQLPERSFDNNAVEFNLNIIKDSLNPLLSVLVDDRVIANGDFVSAAPVITATLLENSTFLPKLAKRNFTINFGPACDSCLQAFVDSNRFSLQSLQSSGDRYKLTFQPGILPAGRYQLLIQATDFSNNTAGNLAYKIQFVVDDQNKIIEVRTYPNPTYQSSALLFSIAGKELPKYLDFDVFDFQGQKIYTKRLAGNSLTYGSNVVLNAWDGRTTGGKQVLSGLYSYRLVAPNGSFIQYSQAPNSTRFGKIVLVN